MSERESCFASYDVFKGTVLIEKQVTERTNKIQLSNDVFASINI